MLHYIYIFDNIIFYHHEAPATEAPTEEPVPTEAPNYVTFLKKYTFDGITETDLFGTTGEETYSFAAGNATLNATALGLDADDQVLVLGKNYGKGTIGRGSSNANTAPGSLAFGNSKGDKFTGVKHATIQFDYL